MPGGYHRLSSQLMEERDNIIIQLVEEGLRHKIIACLVRMEPSGIETRLHKLREEGKLSVGRGKDG